MTNTFKFQYYDTHLHHQFNSFIDNDVGNIRRQEMSKKYFFTNISYTIFYKEVEMDILICKYLLFIMCLCNSFQTMI